MFELQVLANGINVAPQGTAIQSSDFKSNNFKFGAARSLDGDNSTFSHTNIEVGSWWEVDLANEVEVESIIIINRYCRNPQDPNGCLCRLSQSDLMLYDGMGMAIAKRSLGDTCNTFTISRQFGQC